MTKTALACALSVGLHGFLLTQWPSPGGRFPIRHLTEPVQAVYLTSAATPMSHLRAPVPLSPVRSADQFSTRMAATAPAATPLLPAAPRPPPSPPAPLPAAPTRRVVSAPARPDEAAPTWSGPIPSVLTPADFAQFRYKQMVRARLQRAILYPRGHALEGGRARLRLTITREGQVASASCTSVESPMFEESVMAGVAAAGPFPAFPAELPAAQETYEFLVAYTPGAATSVSP